MRIILLAAGLAISSMASAQDLRAQSQSLLEDYGKLPPDKQSILNDAMTHYVVHVFRSDGSEVRAAHGDELKTLAQYELTCDRNVLDEFRNDKVRSAAGIAKKKIDCIRASFQANTAPYTAQLSYN